MLGVQGLWGRGEGLEEGRGGDWEVFGWGAREGEVFGVRRGV